ncbi:hypothetical protein [Jannaschia rubra]|nr:hypothetical protein [Jannaschia rubra]
MFEAALATQIPKHGIFEVPACSADIGLIAPLDTDRVRARS